MSRVSVTWSVQIENLTVCMGAIYGIDAAQKAVLDRWEGRGNGYLDSQLTVELFGKEYCCFTYLSEPSHIENNLKPYHWYKKLVLLGATYLNFPETYVRSIEAIESMNDPDEARRTRHDQLIEGILPFSPCGSEPSYD
ncbi:MAG: gamma-glutamylcyclotransferase [Nitrospira sp.]|nr:gamma-glutamylcyclotransferase [Nitrospira sp.]